jgi:hypothetical protein
VYGITRVQTAVDPDRVAVTVSLSSTLSFVPNALTLNVHWIAVAVDILDTMETVIFSVKVPLNTVYALAAVAEYRNPRAMTKVAALSFLIYSSIPGPDPVFPACASDFS